MNDFKQQAQHITPKTNKKRPYGDYGDGKRLKMKFEELHNDKETNDEYLLNTVKESLNKGELCLFMSETGTFMSTGENDDTEETLTVNKVGILYIYTDYDKYRKSNGEAIESSLDVKAFDILGIDTEEVIK